MDDKIQISVVFRVDASIQTGTGHVMRCLTMANVLAGLGARCSFICREHDGNLLGYVRESGFEAYGLPMERSDDIDLDAQDLPSSAYAAWLGAGWVRDAKETLSILNDVAADWLIVDHYAIDARWERLLRPACRHLMIIDDLANRPHDCDLLLDQNLGRKPADYAHLLNRNCKILAGPYYALLRPEFPEFRHRSLDRRKMPQLKSLLVTMGGIDRGNVTGQVLEALKGCRLPHGCRIVVVMGSRAPWLEQVRAQAYSEEMPWDAEVLVDVRDMAKLMAESDLVIGAAGGTAWERCCLGVPALVAVLANNQLEGANALVTAGCALIFGNAGPIQTDLPPILESFSDARHLHELSLASRAVTDGKGAPRVANLLLEMLTHDL